MKEKSSASFGELTMVFGVALTAAMVFLLCAAEADLALAQTMKVAEIEKFVQSASNDQAMVIESFEIPESKNITGLILRGKGVGATEPNGLEALAFMFQNEKKLVSADFIYSEDGEDLAKRYAYRLNHKLISNGVGRTLLTSPASDDDKPVKTVFVYFDPFCNSCQEMAAGPIPQKFMDQRVRLVWIPIMTKEGSQPYSTYFLHTGKIAKQGEPVDDAISCCPPDLPCQCGSVIVDNTRRYLSLNSGEQLATPFLVWPVAGEGPGFDYHGGLPDDARIRNIADRVMPISYKPFDGSTPPFPVSGPLKNAPNLLETVK